MQTEADNFRGDGNSWRVSARGPITSARSAREVLFHHSIACAHSHVDADLEAGVGNIQPWSVMSIAIDYST
jgi:hypothetical protein